MLRIKGRESSIVYRSEDSLHTPVSIYYIMSKERAINFLVDQIYLFIILPVGFKSKKLMGALISFSNNRSCTLTAARSPPNANANALTKVSKEFARQKRESIACDINRIF